MRLKTLSEITFDIINNIHDTLPQADTSEGEFVRDVFIDPVSNEIALLYEGIKLVELAQSILTATGIALDNLASNYFVTRKGATASSGLLRFYFILTMVANNPNGEMQIPVGAQVSTQGSLTNNSVTVATTSDVVVNVNNGQSYSFDVTSNSYYVDVPAVALTAGAITNTAPNTLVVPITQLDPSIQSVTNPYEFQDGSDQESDPSLALRVSLALLGANIGTNYGYLGFTLKQPGVLNALIVGTGNPLMTRDNGQGGMVDIYVRGKSPTQMVMQFLVDLNYVTGTNTYTSSYSDIVFEYQPLIYSIPNTSIEGNTLTTNSFTVLDVPSLIGTGLNYTTVYKNAANYSYEQGSGDYYLDYPWDFTLLQQSEALSSTQAAINLTFPAGTTVYAVYTYLSVIGETTPSPETAILMSGTATSIDITGGTLLPPGVVGINVYSSTSPGLEALIGSSPYGSLNFTMLSLPTGQGAKPPSINTAGVSSPSIGPTFNIVTSGTTLTTTINENLVPNTADPEALNELLYFNPSGTGTSWYTTTGLGAITYQDYVTLSGILQDISNEITNPNPLNVDTVVTNISYDINWADLTWYQVNQYNASGTYTMVNGEPLYFNQNFNLGIYTDNTIRIIQVVSGTHNPTVDNTPMPSAADRFLVLNNNLWYERRYYQPDFLVYHDTSSTGYGTYSMGTRDAISWLSNASQKPQVGELLTATYNINQLVDDLQNNIGVKRVLTADVMIKQSLRVGINIYIEVTPYSGFSVTTIQNNINNALIQYIGNLSGLGGTVNKSDIIFVARGTNGVESVGLKSLQLSPTFVANNVGTGGQDTYEIQAQPYEYLGVDNIFVNVMPIGYVFNNV